MRIITTLFSSFFSYIVNNSLISTNVFPCYCRIIETFKELQIQGNFRIFHWEANKYWKSINKHYLYFGLSEIVLKKIDPMNLCVK